MITFRSIIKGVVAAVILLGLYVSVVTLLSGWDQTKSQFLSYWYFLVSLALGFGVQITLYDSLKQCGRKATGSVAAVSGTTSAVAMLSCCTHYLANLVPLLATTGIAAFVGQYQIELFWLGLGFNLVGVAFMLSRFLKVRRHMKSMVSPSSPS